MKYSATSYVCALLAMILAVPSGRADDKNKENRLTPKSRLEIVHYVDGEFAQAVRKLPASKKGFRLKIGEPLDEVEKALNQALMNDGVAAYPGDQVQITKVEFRDKEIEFDVNHGPRGKTRRRDRIHVEVSGAPRPRVTTTTQGEQKPPERGATIILDFGKPLPDITPDELKAILSILLDFSKRSAAEQWFDILPQEFKKAIGEHRVILGMDEDMVIATLGRKGDYISREDVEDLQGNKTHEETWRYGDPPSTMFVVFVDNKVVKIRTCRPTCVDGMPVPNK